MRAGETGEGAKLGMAVSWWVVSGVVDLRWFNHYKSLMPQNSSTVGNPVCTCPSSGGNEAAAKQMLVCSGKYLIFFFNSSTTIVLHRLYVGSSSSRLSNTIESHTGNTRLLQAEKIHLVHTCGLGGKSYFCTDSQVQLSEIDIRYLQGSDATQN